MSAQPAELFPDNELSTPARPAFDIPSTLDPVLAAQLQIAETALLESPARNLLGLIIYSKDPSQARPTSLWHILCDPAVPLRFDAATQQAIETQQAEKPQTRAQELRFANLKVFLSRARCSQPERPKPVSTVGSVVLKVV